MKPYWEYSHNSMRWNLIQEHKGQKHTIGWITDEFVQNVDKFIVKQVLANHPILGLAPLPEKAFQQ